MIRTPFTPILFGSLFACSGGGPYPVGLVLKSDITVETETNSYRDVQGNVPVESVGVIGFAETCAEAQTSQGSLYAHGLTDGRENLQVVGQTKVPTVVPDDDHEQKDVWISLVMVTERTGSTVMSSGEYYDPTSETGSYVVEQLEDTPIETEVSYFGVTADDYIAAFTLDSLWPSDDAGLNPTDAQMLTKNKPQKGEIWFSQNGNIVYIYEGKEVVTVSGTRLKSDKVQVYEAAEVEVTKDGIMDQCINEGANQYDGQGTSEDFDQQIAFLDTGCEASFRHTQTGTQWWYEGVLVKAEVTNIDVTVTDYGYEWYSSETGYCERQTSVVRPDVDSDLFIEYEVSESLVKRTATSWAIP
jgi:hypothetical protein